MKVTRIQADNLLGLQHVDVRIETQIALFCGSNGAGKSSIQEAVRMAICKDDVRGVTTKKEYGKLVYGESKAGGAVVTINDDADQTFAFNLPKGDFIGPEITEPMRVALYGQRFAQMTADERRTFLFDLTKLKPKADTVKARMLSEKWDCEEEKVDAVLPLLRTGFPSVCTHAKSKATESKGAWRQVTGGTYGPVAAPKWEAPVPELPEGDAAQMAETVAGLDRNIGKLNESLGAIKTAARAAQETAAKRAMLKDSAGKVDSLVEQLEHAKVELAKYEPTVVALRERAAGKTRVGLVHDMARALAGMIHKATKQNWNDNYPEQLQSAFDAMEAYEKEHGKLENAAAVDTEAQTALPEHERGLQVMQNRVKNLQRDLDSAKQAQGQYDALAPAEDVGDASAEIQEVEAMLAQAKTDRQRIENERLNIEAATRARTEAKAKTALALAHHNDVEAWTKVADALAPDGIPAEMLLAALAPVNAALVQAATDTEWMRVEIGADMAITAAGRPYQLLSESEQWRTDAMIAEVVAEISGLRILMLDRIDVLDLPGRQQLLEWIDSLAFNDVIDTALLFGTLKALPTGLADTISAYWVAGGMIAAESK